MAVNPQTILRLIIVYMTNRRDLERCIRGQGYYMMLRGDYLFSMMRGGAEITGDQKVDVELVERVCQSTGINLW